MSLSGRPSALLLLAFLAWLASSARAQTPQSGPSSLDKEVMEMRTENSAIREQLRKLEEQQKAMLLLMDELQRKLDGRPAAIAQPSPPAPQPELRQRRRNPPLRQRTLPQIETLLRMIPTKTVSSW
jgi:hypothetical protein